MHSLKRKNPPPLATMPTEAAKRLEKQGTAQHTEIAMTEPETENISEERGEIGIREMLTQKDETESFENYYGHKLMKKPQGHIRIATLNVRHFPLEHRDPVKYDGLRAISIDNDLDMVGWSEVGKNWTYMNEEQQLKHTTKKWWNSCSTNCSSLYDKEYREERQVGGTASVVMPTLTGSIVKRGGDERKLGRWTWYSFRGEEAIFTTVITLYRPCNTEITKTGSARSQQFGQIRARFPHITKDPLALFDSDLKIMVENFMEQGHQMVVMGDYNQDLLVTSSPTKKMLERLGLQDGIMSKYGGTAPRTHVYGSRPIDGIFVSPTLHITQGGYAPGDIIVSDHRMLWIDITTASMLGEKYNPILRPSQRKLNTSNPRVKRKFNKIMERALQSCKLVAKTRSLHDKAISGDWNHQIDGPEYEICDALRFRTITHADDKCTKQRGGGIPHSDTLARAQGEITMWKLILARATRKGKYAPRRRMLQRKAKRWKFQGNINETDITTIRKEIERGYLAYSAIRETAAERRKEWLTDKAALMAEEDGASEASHLKRLIDREELRDSFLRIKYAQGKMKNVKITGVEEGPDIGPRRLITKRRDIEGAIRKANEEKLQQANNTPLRESPLREEIQEDQLNYERWERILTGEIQLPQDLDKGTKLWFKKMRDGKATIPPQPIPIDIDSYIDSWKKMKETTSSCPGLHFGHFKAASKQTPRAAAVHSMLAAIPILTGYSPRRWQKCTDAMLRKKAHDIRPEKLRLVTLMAADFNHNNKLIGKHIMANGERAGAFAEEQYGSRKHLSAPLHALNKVLALDVSKQMRQPCVIVANDARSCYDRIVLVAAYCSMMKYGIPSKAAQSMCTTIARLEHSIRTAYGDSQSTYGGQQWDRIPHGIGQGNGAGPALWACVSSPLLDILREQGYGATYQSPITNTTLKLAGFAFVDDADLIQTIEPGMAIKDVVKKAQEGLTLWEECLRTTGGAIEPSKSDWVFIEYVWKAGHWAFRKGKSKHTMTVKNHKGVLQPLKQLRINQARETLGIWIACNGSNKKQQKEMKSKARKWGLQIASSHLSPRDTFTALRTTIMAGLKYSLITTKLTRPQCSDIVSPLYTKVLPKMGLCSRTRRLLLQIPRCFNGLGQPDLWIIQGIDHIKALMDHGSRQSATGKLLQNSIEIHLVELGTAGSILQHDREYDRMEDTWIRNTLQFCNHHKIQLEEELPTLQLWRKRDAFIMDLLESENDGNMTAHQIAATNRCRMFLKATTTSDITNDEGYVRKAAWNLSANLATISSLAYTWPAQHRPSAADISHWQRSLRHVLNLRPEAPNLEFRNTHWNSDVLNHVKWWYDDQQKAIWETTTYSYRKWTPKHGRTRSTAQLFFRSKGKSKRSRRHWRIATVRTITEEVLQLVDTSIRSIQYPQKAQQETTWVTDDHETDFDNADIFCKEIKQGTARVMSDGSYKEGQSTAAFGTVGFVRNVVQGTVRVPGRKEDQSSYRGEVGGILANLTHINRWCQEYHITQGAVTIGCDSEAALWNVFNDQLISTKTASRDLIQACRFQIDNSPLKWAPHHVRGHQDASHGFLDAWALSNIDCDTRANSRRERDDPTPKHALLDGEKWRVRINGQVINSSFAETLHEHCTHNEAYNYWVDRGRVAPNCKHKIDWKVLKRATNMIPTSRLIFLGKNYAGYNPTGKVMLRRKQWPQNACPRCKQEEDHQHVIRCPAASANEQFIQSWGKLDDWIMDTSTLEISQAVSNLLFDYRSHDKDQTIFDEWSPMLQDTMRAQYELGHRSFMEGMLTTMWTQVQQQHFKEINDTRRSAEKWSATLTTKVWQLAYDMWMDRNNTLHRNEQAQKTLHEASIDEHLSSLYAKCDRTLPHADRQLFKRPLEQTLQLKLREKRRLVKLMDAAIQAQTSRRSNKQAKALRAWLQSFSPA